MSEEYWENRYKNGGNSGSGSRGDLRTWKWKIITFFIKDLDDIIDVGCGDLAFMESKTPKTYVGIDISPEICKKNKSEHPTWTFCETTADKQITNLEAKVVFCHDLLFHITDDDTYYKILTNLMKYSTKYISIYTWDKNPIPWYNLKAKYYGSDKYQKYRNFDKDVWLFQREGFELVSKNKTELNKYGALYIFEKVQP